MSTNQLIFNQILHSSHRLLNSNQPLFWMSPTINPDAPKSTDVLDADPFNGLPTSSSVDSFYSDQSSQAGQSSMPPTTNGWSSMVPTTNVASFKDSQLDNHVKNILVPRVSGTPGNVKVRQVGTEFRGTNDSSALIDRDINLGCFQIILYLSVHRGCTGGQ